MGRKAKFSHEDFVTGAIDIMATSGPENCTIGALAKRLGAPTGSIYHRFPSRQVLLGEAWIELVEDFQTDLVGALNRLDGLSAALHTPRWVRKKPDRARVLFLYRREQVVGDWPDELAERGEALSKGLTRALMTFTEQLTGRLERDAVTRMAFATIDMPLGAVLRFVASRQPIPIYIDDFIREAYLAVTDSG